MNGKIKNRSNKRNGSVQNKNDTLQGKIYLRKNTNVRRRNGAQTYMEIQRFKTTTLEMAREETIQKEVKMSGG